MGYYFCVLARECKTECIISVGQPWPCGELCTYNSAVAPSSSLELDQFEIALIQCVQLRASPNFKEH